MLPTSVLPGFPVAAASYVACFHAALRQWRSLPSRCGLRPCCRNAPPASLKPTKLLNSLHLHSSTSNRRPACRVFVANSLCCMDYGIVQHASVRLWVVCTADVYLPDPKCLTGEPASCIACADGRAGVARRAAAAAGLRLGCIAAVLQPCRRQSLRARQVGCTCIAACIAAVRTAVQWMISRGRPAACYLAVCTLPYFCASPAYRCAVTDQRSGLPIPPLNETSPDPYTSINTTVLATPNARSRGGWRLQ